MPMDVSPKILLRKLGMAALALMLALCPSEPMAALAGPASLEYQLKAAFLLNFTRYVEWRGRSGGTNDLKICVLGPDVFGTALDAVAANKTVNGRRIVIRKNLTSQEAAACDVVYISLADNKEIREALHELESTSALTVGEGAGFLEMGGMIAFTPQEGKLRFYINASAAKRAGIAISARLMALARNLPDEGERRR
jgi:hypothetical protein